MSYNKKYYQENREKLLKEQREWNRKHYKGRGDKKRRIASLKAWVTRLENPNQKYIPSQKELNTRLKILEEKIKELEKK